MGPTTGDAAADATQAAAAALLALPPLVRTLIVVFAVFFKAALWALRDTLISKICAWVLPKLSLYGYYFPANIVFVVFHLYFFIVGQSSWRTSAKTLVRLISRDDADDDLLTKLFLEGSDLTLYVFMSLLFRNVGTIWRFCVWTFDVLTPLLSFFGVASIMWFVMIDNPILTFNTEVARLVSFTWPKVFFCIRKLNSAMLTTIRHTLRLFVKLMKALVAYRDTKTARYAATLTKYKYAALGAGEIRLLKLSKLTPWSPVRCELLHVPLATAPPFETISYTWGARKDVKPLILNGRCFEVYERVYEIVHDRASYLMTRHIWIDSICINQSDDNEKSSQVQLMRKIYGSSYHTVVWLGHADDANDAIGFLAHLRRRMDFDDPDARAALSLMNLNIENPSWPALNRLIKHDYWARCWVIQEIAVSKKVIVSYGGELISWDYFSSLMQVIFNSDPNSVWHISKIYWRSQEPPPMDAGIQVASLGLVRERVHSNQSMELFDILIFSINSTATDARDNVFAVQGLSTAVDSGDIMPDYKSTIERPFLKTAEYLLKGECPSRILHLSGIGFHRNAEVKTSWVPDWSTKRVAVIYWRNTEKAPWRASNTFNEEPMMQLGTDGLTLTTKGIRVDRIKVAGPQFFGVSENGVPKAQLYPGSFTCYAQSRDLVFSGSLSEPYVTGVSLIEAFWRTLLGDRTPAGTWPADPTFFSYYQAMENFIKALSDFGLDLNPLDPGVSIEDQEKLGVATSNYALDSGRFANVSGPHTRERMFAITERGYIGMVPPYSQVGDEVFIIPGAQVPFLMRRQQAPNGDKWQLVGESFIYGMMEGEMMAEGGVEQVLELC